MTGLVVNGFAGPGGWCVALQQLGLASVGLELDAAACATRAAAGHLTIRTDVTRYPTAPFKGRITGKVDSPVCTPFSRAGQQQGIADLPLIHQAVHDLAHGRDTRAGIRNACRNPLSILAAEPMRWHHDLRPAWIAMKQVPDVLPLWQQYAGILRGWGYSVWTGVVNAANHGVPQTRSRAVLAASRLHAVTAPEVTHAERADEPLFGPRLHRWVSMADALGLEPGLTVNTRGERRTPGGNEFPADRPCQGLTGRARSWWVLRNGNQPNAAIRRMDQPAPTIAFGHNAARVEWVLMPGGRERRRLQLWEAAVLQGFPADYPWTGSRTARFQQVGNAVPPPLAAAVITAATGHTARLGAAA